jgi:hypothetical protein
MSVFDDRYKNDDTGAPAFDPRVLLKIILYAYSRGITSSRKIEQACRENIIFMALSADTQPHFTTIADSGFYNKNNLEYVYTHKIDAYLPDLGFRKRDPRFQAIDKNKARHRQEQQRTRKTQHYTSQDFHYDAETHTCICPAGKQLYSNGRNLNLNSYEALRFRGAKRDCEPCGQRRQCMKNPSKTVTRQATIFIGRSKQAPQPYVEHMKHKIDTPQGRFTYSRRIGIVEPVFANICHTLGLNRFSHRGKKKVNIQWKLYCMVHNLLKIHRYGNIST